MSNQRGGRRRAPWSAPQSPPPPPPAPCWRAPSRPLPMPTLPTSQIFTAVSFTWSKYLIAPLKVLPLEGTYNLLHGVQKPTRVKNFVCHTIFSIDYRSRVSKLQEASHPALWSSWPSKNADAVSAAALQLRMLRNLSHPLPLSAAGPWVVSMAECTAPKICTDWPRVAAECSHWPRHPTVAPGIASRQLLLSRSTVRRNFRGSFFYHALVSFNGHKSLLACLACLATTCAFNLASVVNTAPSTFDLLNLNCVIEPGDLKQKQTINQL